MAAISGIAIAADKSGNSKTLGFSLQQDWYNLMKMATVQNIPAKMQQGKCSGNCKVTPSIIVI